MADDLVEFLRARLDEDERAARAATPSPWTYGTGVVRGGPDRSPTVAREVPRGDYQHIARHDPARVLREVEAKRAILEEHEPEPLHEGVPKPYCELCQCPDGIVQGFYPCPTVAHLAAMYNAHPEYRPEWRP